MICLTLTSLVVAGLLNDNFSDTCNCFIKTLPIATVTLFQFFFGGAAEVSVFFREQNLASLLNFCVKCKVSFLV